MNGNWLERQKSEEYIPKRAFRNTGHEHSIESNWRRKDNVENEKA
jgi:hypothetical protein